MLSSRDHIKFKLIAIALFVYVCTNGQNKDADKFSAFSFSIDASSDNNVNGRFSMFGSQPTLSSMAGYYHKWGFDVSIMYTNVWQSDENNSSATQEFGLSLGYNVDFTDWLSGSASYNHYNYSENSHSVRSVYKYLTSASLYSEIDWWLTDATLGYYSGKEEELFIALETGFSIDLNNVFKEGNTLSVQPMVSGYVGDINYYNTYNYTNYYFTYSYAKSFPELTVGQFIYIMENPKTYRQKRISERIGNKINRLYELPMEQVIWELFEEQEAFNFNNIGFTIPVFYYWGNFMINASFSAYRPVNQPSYVNKSWGTFTNTGITYFISW